MPVIRTTRTAVNADAPVPTRLVSVATGLAVASISAGAAWGISTVAGTAGSATARFCSASAAGSLGTAVGGASAAGSMYSTAGASGGVGKAKCRGVGKPKVTVGGWNVISGGM